jgi:hypothetical protein
VATAAEEEMNGTIRWRMDGRIVEMPKLLIKSKNTYKRRKIMIKKKNQKGRERVKTKSRKGSEEEEETYFIYSPFRYFFEGEGPREYD